MTTCPRCLRTYEDGVRFCPADGAVVAPSTDPYLGKVLLGQFELTALAGRGAMGTVYKAEQTTMGRTVAVKILRRDLLKDTGVVKRFLREARAAARLSHPSIVTVHLVGETEDGAPYIVMEFVDGPSLGALCEREGVLSPRRAIQVAKQIASALSEAHGHGIVHRDLKPENILLVDKKRATDHVKVLDFGIAKILRDEAGEVSALTRDGTIFGTPHYISPEQAGGQEVDARADLYSLGVILFRMATGRLPFEGTSGMQVLLRHIKEQPPRPRAIRPGLPDALDALIHRSLQKSPADRYQDAEQLIEALSEVEAVLDDPAQTIHGVAPPRAQGAARPPLPQVARSSDPRSDRELDAWSAAPLPDAEGEVDSGTSDTRETDEPTEKVDLDRDYFEEARRPRSRLVWWAGAAAVVVGAGAGLLYAIHGGANPPPATPAPTPVAAKAMPDLAKAAPPPLVEERVVSAGPYAMRLGFESAPVEGSRSVLRLSIDDAQGAMPDAKVEVGLRPSGGHEELVAVRSEPGGGAYLADLGFRSAGKHHLRVIAGLPKGGPLRSAFDFVVAAGEHEPAVAAPPTAPKHRDHAARGSDGDDDKQLPTTVIQPPPLPPTRPRALGPSPSAFVPTPAPTPQPPASMPPPPPTVVATPPDPSPAPEDDPYKILDHR